MVNMYSQYLVMINADRIKALQVIEDMRKGKGFEHYEQRYKEPEKIKFLTKEERRKLYESNNYIDRIISEIVNLSPKLKNLKYSVKSENKINLIKKSLEAISWCDLDIDITDSQIFKADVFLEIYFVKGDSIPRLRKLDSKKMTDIARDEYGRVIAYIYKDRIVNEEVDYIGNSAVVDRESEREVTWVFERGKTTIIDPYNLLKDENGEVVLDSLGKPQLVVDEDGNTIPEITIVPNKEIFHDEFYLLHIPSIKQTDNAFSDIIASKYIDPALKLDAIVSDIRYANRMISFGLNIVVDGKISTGSSLTPGSFIFIKSIDDTHTAHFQREEIKNSLITLEQEKLDTEIDLHRKSFIMRPDMEKAMASSDSSRNTQQLRLPLEKFLHTLVLHKNNAMKKYFELVQLSAGYKKLDSFEFEIPNPIIENSVFDQLLQDMQELEIGRKTMRDLWVREGLTEKEMQERENQLNKENINGKNDIKIDKEIKNVSNSANNVAGLDNNFKK